MTEEALAEEADRMPDGAPEEPADASAICDEECVESKKRGRTYLVVWIMLFVLTIIELYTNRLIDAKSGQIAFLTFLMISKAMLVVLYYMHLIYESRILRWTAGIPFGGAVFFVVIVIIV
jgi:caa(3)-type oxidase subunit IV